MAPFSIKYQQEYGVQSSRSDRFSGEPSWLETAIREYEVGPRGPHHECGGYCDCVSCARLEWLRNPICSCVPKYQWGLALTLDNALRSKWKLCRCQPRDGVYSLDSTCKCILLMETQEYIPSEGTPSPVLSMDYYPPYTDSEGPSPDSSSGHPDGYLPPGCVAIIERMLSAGWKLPPPGYDPFTGTWECPEAEAAAAYATTRTGDGRDTAIRVDELPRDDVSDTATSSGRKRKPSRPTSPDCATAG